MNLRNTHLLFGILAAWQQLVVAHRSLPSGTTCGSQFFSPETALTIPNPLVSWASYRIFDCDQPVFWLDAQTETENQTLHFTVTIPVIERFEDVRMSVVIIGPDLPSLSADANVPEDVSNYINENNMGASLFESLANQTTCDHLQSVMGDASSVVDDRCHFYEPFGGSNSWVVLDESYPVETVANYKIAVFVEGGTTAKAAFACCDWPEDFVTPYTISETDCPYCGNIPEENPAFSSYFFEQKSMIEYGGFPPALSCMNAESMGLTPFDSQCPPVKSTEQEAQPAGCVLGCTVAGECHSHNVFGECTHQLEWGLTPKFGEAEVKELIIYKGDSVSFNMPQDQNNFVHNLFELANLEHLEQCNFDDSLAVANVEEIRLGHIMNFDKEGTYHFACGISCTGFPEEGSDETDTASTAEARQASFCHCDIGQKITVVVKDATEGLRCHDHASFTMSLSEAAECAEGEVKAHAIDSPDYGAMDGSECAELCTSAIALSFMTGVESGTCAEAGFVGPWIAQREVKPPGSPMAMQVSIASNELMKTCHCHSYEEISCPEDEAADDTLYDEHIDEIEEYCATVLDGSEDDCPYRCFQPMEVLHLHYLECSTRPIDATFVAVNATNLCHIAADAPDDTDCPKVELGMGGGMGSEEESSSQMLSFASIWYAVFSIAIMGLLHF